MNHCDLAGAEQDDHLIAAGILAEAIKTQLTMEESVPSSFDLDDNAGRITSMAATTRAQPQPGILLPTGFTRLLFEHLPVASDRRIGEAFHEVFFYPLITLLMEPHEFAAHMVFIVIHLG